jgi:hypothetical protein
LGWLDHTQPAKQFFKKNLIWPLGVADPPPRAMGWRHPPPSDQSGVAEATPMALGGGLTTPNGQINFLKKICLALGGGRTTPRAISKTTKNIYILFFIF